MNLRNRIKDSKNPREKVSFMPTSVQIEPTTKCNLRCVMCEHTYMKQKAVDLDLKTFRNVLDSNPFLRVVNLTGIGESLLNPGLMKMVEYAKSKDLYVWFTDNFTLMDKKTAEKLVELKLDALDISLDSARKENYERIRGGAKFEKVIENLKGMVEVKKRFNAKRPELFVTTVVMEENAEEMPEIIELIHSIGVKKIIFVGMLKFAGSKGKGLRGKEKIREIFRETEKKAEEMGVEIIGMPNLDPVRQEFCSFPWTGLYVTAEGKALPCCFATQRNNPALTESSALGDFKKQGFKGIWKGEKYGEFRKKILEKDWPEICRGCERIKSIY